MLPLGHATYGGRSGEGVMGPVGTGVGTSSQLFVEYVPLQLKGRIVELTPAHCDPVMPDAYVTF